MFSARRVYRFYSNSVPLLMFVTSSVSSAKEKHVESVENH